MAAKFSVRKRISISGLSNGGPPVYCKEKMSALGCAKWEFICDFKDDPVINLVIFRALYLSYSATELLFEAWY